VIVITRELLTHFQIRFYLTLVLLLVAISTCPSFADPAAPPAGSFPQPAGVILSPDGKPLAGADIYLIYQNSHFTLVNGSPDSHSTKVPELVTNVDGKFSFPAQTQIYLLIVYHNSGYAEVTSDQFVKSSAIKLTPWSTLEGTVRVDAKTETNPYVIAQHIKFYLVDPDQLIHKFHFAAIEDKAPIDKNGHYILNQVPSGEVSVSFCATRSSAPSDTMIPFLPNEAIENTTLFLGPGKTGHADIGTTGRSVIGKFACPPETRRSPDLTSHYILVLNFPSSSSMPYPNNWFDLTATQQAAWKAAWWQSPQGRACQLAAFRYIQGQIQKDGSFRFDHVPPGAYFLIYASFDPKSLSAPILREYAQLYKIITVPKALSGHPDQPYNMGTVLVYPMNQYSSPSTAKLPIHLARPVGVVLSPNGKPLAGADVYLAYKDSLNFDLINGVPNSVNSYQIPPMCVTDADGKFSFPAQTENYLLFVTDNSGYAVVLADQFVASSAIRITPWSTIEGTARSGLNPNRNAYVKALREVWGDQVRSEFPYFGILAQATIDKNGHYILQKVPSGRIDVMIYVYTSPEDAEPEENKLIFLDPGKTAHVDIGTTGRPVIGKLAWSPGAHHSEMVADNSHISLELQQPPIPYPDNWFTLTSTQKQAWMNAWLETLAGRAYQLSELTFVSGQMQNDGLFRFANVPPGNYFLNYEIYGDAAATWNGMPNPIGTIEKSITIVPIPGGYTDKPLDLGTLSVIPYNDLHAGDAAPPFTLQTLDGHVVKLSDLKGKVVLLDFWATWCGPCLMEMPYLQQVYSKYGGNKNFVMISISLDMDLNNARKYVKVKNLCWIQAGVGDIDKQNITDDYNCHGIPAIFVIGADSKIVGRDLWDNGIQQTVARALAALSTAATQPTASDNSDLQLGLQAVRQKNYQQAFIYWQKAAAAGNATAMLYLGLLYVNGKGISQNYQQAFAWWQKAAALGNSEAMNNIGVAYNQGRMVPQDYHQAVIWFQKAAAAGNANAMLNIGLLYVNGRGVPQDYKQAFSLWQKAAALGNSQAMTNIGVAYTHGHMVPQDYHQAMVWFQEAAALGNFRAMYDISKLYENGEGVPKDASEAKIWLNKAAQSGDPAAQNDLNNLPAQ